MTILIQIDYIGWESNIQRKGNFPVNSLKFKNDPDLAAAEVALKWMIRREHNLDEILKVMYNK